MWKTEYRCFNCHKRLSTHTVFYSHGRCPLCGVKHKDACTIIETEEVAYRDDRSHLRWWEFWKPSRRIYADQ